MYVKNKIFIFSASYSSCYMFFSLGPNQLQIYSFEHHKVEYICFCSRLLFVICGINQLLWDKTTNMLAKGVHRRDPLLIFRGRCLL